MPGALALKVDFWEKEILALHPRKDELLSYVKGVRIEQFLNERSVGVYKGQSYGSVLPPSRHFDNYISEDSWQGAWITSEVNKLHNFGVLWKWDPKIMGTEIPRVTLPLHLEPNKG